MNREKGFTLIELMIVVAILGILVAIAYPSYVEYVRDARRADAQADMVELSQWMERQFTVNGNYSVGALPFTKSPKDGADTSYTLVLTAASVGASTFTITAAPVGGQAGQACGTMTVTQTGAKTPPDCW